MAERPRFHPVTPVFARPLRLLAALFSCAALRLGAATVYVAPDASASGSGATADQPAALAAAVSRLQPGDTLVLRGGRYALARRLTLSQRATADHPITLTAAPGERPVLDGDAMPADGGTCVIRIEGDYYHLIGLEITHGYLQGILTIGSHNRFERCVAHHNGGPGFAVTLSHGENGNADGERAAYNVFVNCDSYLNFDWHKVRAGKKKPGSDADGFACSLGSGKGNTFYGCRSWKNSDDGWDCFESGYGVVIVNCWTWQNGQWSDFAAEYQARTGDVLTAELFAGDGNGFKLGGNHSTGGNTCHAASRGTNVLRNAISFGNRSKGIDQNGHKDGVCVENCVSFDNGKNIRFWSAPNPGRKFVFRNNVIFGRGTTESGLSIPAVLENNTWQTGLAAGPADFVTLTPEAAAAPRAADGALPAEFGRLKPTSRLVDGGARTERVVDPGIDLAPIAFAGAAPDLGAYECR